MTKMHSKECARLLLAMLLLLGHIAAAAIETPPSSKKNQASAVKENPVQDKQPIKQSSPLKIGWAIRSVSSDLPVSIPGNFDLRISKGLADALYVTALTIDNGQDSVVWLSCDHLHLVTRHVNQIKKRIREISPAFPVNKLIINSTHIHTGGALLTPGRHGVPENIPFDEKGEYATLFTNAAAEAITESWQKRQPGQVAWGYGFVAAGFSRRTVYQDDLSLRPNFQGPSRGVFLGHATMSGPNDVKFSHYEAGMDPIANFLFTYSEDGKLTGAIINLSTTAQCGTPDRLRLSADFWHETRLAFKKKYGDIFILPQCAAAGDIIPRQQHYRKAMARRLRLKFGEQSSEYTIQFRLDMAERIMTAFDEVEAWASKEKHSSLPMEHVIIKPRLERATPPPQIIELAQKYLPELEKQDADPKNANESLTKRSARRTKIAKYKRVINATESVAKEPTYETELHIVRLGEIAFASNPFELFIDYMHRIQRLSPFEQTFIVQLAMMGGRAGGYLPTQRAEDNLGYSAEPGSHSISPKGGQTLVNETMKALKSMYQKEPSAR